MNIAFPLRFDATGRTARCDDQRHIRDMIEAFLFTAPGERVNRPDFGSGLLQMTFAPNSPELAAALHYTIRAGLDRWLGDVIEVRALEVSGDDAQVLVDITYAVRRTGAIVETRFDRRLS